MGTWSLGCLVGIELFFWIWGLRGKICRLGYMAREGVGITSNLLCVSQSAVLYS